MDYQYLKSILVFLVGIASVVLFVMYFAAETDRRKRLLGTLLGLLLCGFGAFTLLSEPLKKGIDLAGGASFLVKINPSEGKPITPDAVNAAKEILEKRLSPLGNKDVVITSQGSDMLYVEVPGVSTDEITKNRETIEKVAKLDFRLLHEESESKIAERGPDEQVMEPGYVELPFHDKLKDKDGNSLEPKPDPADAKLSREEQAKKRLDWIYKEKKTVLVKRKPELGGKSVKSAFATQVIGTSNFHIKVELHSEYGEQMEKVTQENLNRPLAIVVDDEVISAPTIKGTFGADFEISGSFTQEEAVELATSLENPLENPLVIQSISQTSATYGEQTVRQGIWAGVAGLLGTLVFMMVYYRLAGVIAVVGLVVNMLLLLASMVVFDFTLTMPGIAGIILTLGVAIDANVLIYERMREEFKSAKNLAGAVQGSYSKAFTAIFDSNFTSLITAITLVLLAASAIKGFGVTLAIGILASLFSALLITRVCFNWLQSGGLKSLRFLSLFANRYIDFMSKRKVCAMLSLFLVLLGIGTFITKGSHTLGYELRGGSILSIPATGITQEQITETLKPITQAEDDNKKLGPFSFTVQKVSPAGSDPIFNIRTNPGHADEARAALQAAFPTLQAGEIQSIGAVAGERQFFGTMPKVFEWIFYKQAPAGTPVDQLYIGKSGDPLVKRIQTPWLHYTLGLIFLVPFGGGVLTALFWGLVGIFIYLTFRYEIPFAIGGIVAIFHDVLIVAGLCALLGKELGMIMVGALLTVAGYSINDTIVIFDRIRDTLKESRDDIETVMNKSISATLSRTVLTSTVTLIVVGTMWIFGGAAMSDFALAMCFGIVVGTYSSMFVASPIVLWWAKRRKLNLRKAIIDAEAIKAQALSGIEREVVRETKEKGAKPVNPAPSAGNA